MVAGGLLLIGRTTLLAESVYHRDLRRHQITMAKLILI
jgi:hypothetical protein